MRRTFAFLPSTIALIVVALFASHSGAAVSATRVVHAALTAAQAPADASGEGTNLQANDPDVPGRTAFLHAQGVSLARIHAPQASGNDDVHIALGAERALLDLAARRAPGAAVDARQDGVTSPGLPAPSSRAPPIG